jgi:hypothetical protein
MKFNEKKIEEYRNKYEKMKFATKSEMFLKMYQDGLTVGEISKVTGSVYSFVYGVVDGKVGIDRKEGESKSDTIRKLVDEGKTAGDIAKELNSNYSFVFSVVKKYKQTKEKLAK